MTTKQSTIGYDPFSVKPLQIRTRRIFAPSGGSISLTTATILVATLSAYFYFLVPLEYIRPDIIGWNRTARAREALTKTQDKRQ
ncbi:unnamed protein product [Rotaria sordida]|uniref:Uncharacterized protein n=1 Tax=Rotaria sordida TaxID=392033 RepID=A0A818Q3L7_9BILA|nr:unnamed protein product [Rotaria sordida]CAF3664616.1 unnamed protein product [Rotaria sordida]CAF3719285.1 unnamed protein product [Rotaria sordida]